MVHSVLRSSLLSFLLSPFRVSIPSPPAFTILYPISTSLTLSDSCVYTKNCITATNQKHFPKREELREQEFSSRNKTSGDTTRCQLRSDFVETLPFAELLDSLKTLRHDCLVKVTSINIQHKTAPTNVVGHGPNTNKGSPCFVQNLMRVRPRRDARLAGSILLSMTRSLVVSCFKGRANVRVWADRWMENCQRTLHCSASQNNTAHRSTCCTATTEMRD